MATLIERARQVIAAENDDFFNADTILYYLNAGQKKVASFAVKTETEMTNTKNARKSLRVLDNLRSNVSTDVTTLTVEAVGDYFVTQVTLPSTISQFQFLRYKDRVVLRELNAHELVKLDWGNLKPSPFEGYYYITNDGSNKVFEVYLHEDLSGGSSATNYIKVFYVKEPTDLTLTSESLPELPEQLENAVIYAAAEQMVLQESVKDPQSQADRFKLLYQEELQQNMY